MRVSILAIMGLAMAWGPAHARPARAPEFELEDQFGHVLTIADREGAEQLEGWIRALVQRYGDSIEIWGLARVVGVPRTLRPLLRAMFRSRVPHPVMLDWDGRIVETLGFQPRLANVLIIETDGRIVARFTGPAHPDALQTCFQVLEAGRAMRAQNEG